MRWALAALLGLHGLVHFLGAAKAFEWADLPQLTLPPSRLAGVAWLTAGLLVLGAALTFPWWPRWWWVVGGAAAVVSQWMVLSSWSDARYGTIPNVLLLVLVVYAFAATTPASSWN